MQGFVLMTLPFRPLLMAVAVVIGLYAPASAGAPLPLTKVQIERFIKSFDAMLDMASEYWGDRRYTPHGTIMPPRGTIDRALVEMEAGGIRQEFERLFLDMKFKGYAEWIQVGQRITHAQMQAVTKDRDAPPLGMEPQFRKKQLERRTMLSKPDLFQMPEAVRLAQLKQIEAALAEDEKWRIATRDMAAIRPYQEKLKELGRKRHKLVRAARTRESGARK
jgi:hypothetical protein